MNKIIPIKVTKTIPWETKYFAWKIHNVCNYSCSFCGLAYRDGSNRWLSLDKYKEVIDKLVRLCENNPFWLMLTGGEPTLYPKLVDLLLYMKSKNIYSQLHSNGSRTIRWWEELKEHQLVDHLHITYHSEMTTDYKHIAEVVNLFHDEPVKVILYVTYVHGTFKLAKEAFEYFKKNTGCVLLLKVMNPGQKYDDLSYSIEDRIYQKLNLVTYGKLKDTKRINNKVMIDGNVDVLYSDGNISKNIMPMVLQKNNQHEFLNWMCNIGKESLIIEYDKVYRGVCQVGESFSIDDDFKFFDNFIKCTVPRCFCHTDLIADKYKPE